MSRQLKKYRTYFDKNNTIVLNSLVNTANNPVSELTFGESCSRFLLFSCFSELRNKYINGELDPNIATHKLYLKNTSNYDVSQTLTNNSLTYDGKLRAYSVDLELHLIDEYWDSGIGYDYYKTISDTSDERSFVNGPSNWFYRTTMEPWSTPGAVSGNSQPISVYHLNDGGEDLEFDITDIVNRIITNTSLSGYTENTYQGFMVKYPSEVELDASGLTSFLGFFSKHTQSYFEPYIETTQNFEIYDNRRRFINGRDNHLYFYSVVGGKLTDLDDLPSLNIEGKDDIYVVERVTKGIYRAMIPSTSQFNNHMMYHDIWSNLKINNTPLASITLDFVVHDGVEYFDLGLINTETELYGISLSGIKLEERIKGGEVRTIKASIRKPYTPNFIAFDYEIYYTLYIKQGINRVTVIDWTKLDFLYSGHEFTLDATWLIPQQYYVDIKVVTNNEVRILNEELKFTIVSDFTNKTKQ